MFMKLKWNSGKIWMYLKLRFSAGLNIYKIATKKKNYCQKLLNILETFQ